MITSFGSLYAGHVDLDNIGLDGTPVNDRFLTDEHLATVHLASNAATRHRLKIFNVSRVELSLRGLVDDRLSQRVFAVLLDGSGKLQQIICRKWGRFVACRIRGCFRQVGNLQHGDTLG